MLIDHIAKLYPSLWLNAIGRIAFPIFAFQLAEGFVLTHNKKNYFKRLFLAAIVSEIPFDLANHHEPFYFKSQSVMLTFVLAFGIMFLIEKIISNPKSKNLALYIIGIVFILLLSVIINPDYNVFGVLLVVAFYICNKFNNKWARLIPIILFVFTMPVTTTMPICGFAIKVHYFSILSAIPILLYNGEKGIGGKKFQLFAYLFYPIHLFIIYLLSICLF